MQTIIKLRKMNTKEIGVTLILKKYFTMKKIILINLLFFIVIRIDAQLVFYNLENYPLLGKISSDTETLYERLPGYLKDISRSPLWNKGKNTAGLSIRFRSNSTQIAAKWELYKDHVMNHMAFIGIKGLDLYAFENNKWVFVNSARPTGKTNQAMIVSNMDNKMREFMLFLPLFDGVTSLEIGIDSLSLICQPELNLPNRNKPIICYGTSIMQGGCASRPGMALTNILTRWLNIEFINLGFGDNGRLDYEIAELISGHDASAIILDFLPNVNPQQVEEKTEKFYRLIRERSPDIPVIFIENPIFPKAQFDLQSQNNIIEKNEALNKVFDQLIKSGEKNIKIISSKGMIGTDNEATVDGVHYTDLGFMRYAEFLMPYLIEFVK